MSDYARWRDRLARVCDPLFWPITVIDQMLADGTAQFWATDKAALVTYVRQYPGGAVVVESIVASGPGAIEDIIEKFGPVVEKWARSIGAVQLRSEGRLGWVPTMKKHGWKYFQCTITKGLADDK